jgi:hypothetical protein
MKEENKAIGRPRTEILSDGKTAPVEEATILDYVMFDFSEDSFRRNPLHYPSI